ncbi:MAG TPA: erythromycin esterase family protein [Kofleriaceae bacterium]|nr:erythromycin esterase family protein [Kofleriaceae bacterium]
MRLPERSTPALVIAGAVRDPAGRPVPDAVVAAFPLEASLLEAKPRAIARSGARGEWALSVDGGQDYSITVAAAGRSPAYLPWSAAQRRGAAERALVTVGAQDARELRGRLITHDGRPAASGMVRVFPPLPGRKQQEIYLALPGEDGQFRVSLPRGEYLLIGDAPGATFSVARVQPDQPERAVELRLRPPARAMPRTAVDDLRRSAVPVDIAAYGGGQPHGERLRASLCGARVVGIGESTHGSSEFTRFRGQVLLHLAAGCGFNALLIESDMSVAAEIDDFVLTGRGDPAALASRLGSWPYAHQEFLALVREVRAHNARSGTPVHILGIDPYYPQLPARKLLAYLKRHGRRLHDRVVARLGVMERVDFREWYGGAGEGEHAALRASLGEVDAFLEAQERRRGGADGRARAALHLRAMQSIEREVSGMDRGQTMADNARWLLDRYVPGGKAVLAAHNGHVLLADPVWKVKETGDWLAEAFGDRYVSVGVLFGKGSFRALFAERGKPPELRIFSLGEPAPESLESVLGRVGPRAFYVDLRGLEGATRSWLESELPCREVGSMYSSEDQAAQRVAPALSFHALAYIGELTAIDTLP